MKGTCKHALILAGLGGEGGRTLHTADLFDHGSCKGLELPCFQVLFVKTILACIHD